MINKKKLKHSLSQRRQNHYRKEKCTACNGSGYYDIENSPKCSSCEGTGIKHECVINYDTK